jgi:hypothetical protein
VAEAVAQWDGLNSKKQLSPPRERAGMTRTSKEWAQPPQAAAIAALSLLEIVKIGEARSKPLPEGNRPISGVRVLSLTRVLAGPTCARTLAEYGADVLKITARHLPNLGYQEWDTGQGKLSAELDLRESANVEKVARARPRGGRVLTGRSLRHSCGARPRTRAIGGNATLASCASHSALSATQAHGPPDAVLTPLRKLLAGSPSARPSGCRASHRGHSSIPCRPSYCSGY